MLLRKLLLLVLLMTIPGLAVAYDGPTGLASLTDVGSLPQMFDGVRSYQVSSRDRGNGNYDSGNFLYQDGKEYVMMDATGPGQICRLWVTNVGANNHIRVYIDGETKPRIDMSTMELFSGSVYPFVWPLVGNDSVSSGGYYSYVPIAFKNGCKVTTDCSYLYYNVQYQLFDSPDGVESYQPCCDSREAAKLWADSGKCPTLTIGAKKTEKSGSLPAGGTAELLDYSGSGRIVALRIKMDGIGTGEESISTLRSVWLRIYWDGNTEPAVDAPIGPFHCVWFPQSKARGLFVGSEKPGEFYCYYPMPFETRARIALVNLSGVDISGVSAEVDVLGSQADGADIRSGKIGRFSAIYRQQALNEGDPDYVFANLQGTGAALGVSILMIGAPERGQGFLEGDERIYYDGSLTPQLPGTGTEDFYNCGYYFDRGLVTLPLHGYTQRVMETRDQEAVYRQLFQDKLQYRNGLRFGMEHGGTNDQAGNYASVVWYYDAGAPTLVTSDVLDIGSTASERDHSFTIGGKYERVTLSSGYEGADARAKVTDEGITTSAPCEFTVQMKEKGRVILRRSLDYSMLNQKASVYVDGKPAGTWYDAGSDNYLKWRDSDFVVPFNLTSAKESVRVRIEPLSEWAQFKYAALQETREPAVLSKKKQSEAPVSITGTVKDSGGEVAAGAVVSALNEQGSEVASAITCPDGSYEIRGVALGTYNIQAKSARIVPYTVYDVEISPSKPVALDIVADSSCANLLANPDFNKGFTDGVASGWTAFRTDNYPGVLSAGDNGSQHIYTPEYTDGDCYLGIYQKLKVIPSQLYVMSAECMTSFGGKEDNPWDNIMARMVINPVASTDVKSKETDAFSFPADHGVMHRMEQQVSAVKDQVVAFYTAWRKFPRGGNDASVDIRNCSFYGPTTPPSKPAIDSAKWEGGAVDISWSASDGSKGCRFALSKSRNERDIVVPWSDGDTGKFSFKASDLLPNGKYWLLLKYQNELGVWSEITVAPVAMQ